MSSRISASSRCVRDFLHVKHLPRECWPLLWGARLQGEKDLHRPRSPPVLRRGSSSRGASRRPVRVRRGRAVQPGGAERHSPLAAQHRRVSRSLLRLAHSLAPCSCGEPANSACPGPGGPSEHSIRGQAASAPSGRAENASKETPAHSQHKFPPGKPRTPAHSFEFPPAAEAGLSHQPTSAAS